MIAVCRHRLIAHSRLTAKQLFVETMKEALVEASSAQDVSEGVNERMTLVAFPWFCEDLCNALALFFRQQPGLKTEFHCIAPG